MLVDIPQFIFETATVVTFGPFVRPSVGRFDRRSVGPSFVASSDAPTINDAANKNRADHRSLTARERFHNLQIAGNKHADHDWHVLKPAQ